MPLSNAVTLSSSCRALLYSDEEYYANVKLVEQGVAVNEHVHTAELLWTKKFVRLLNHGSCDYR